MALAEEKAERYVGGGVPRKEDPALLTGQSKFIDDISFPGMAWVGIVRSPLAHARINSVDSTRAKELPGVIAVYSGQDLADDWAGGLPCAWPLANRSFPAEPTTEDPRLPDHWPVAKEKACFAGDPVAVVVADSREHAKDAIEAVDVDYEPLDPVLEIEDALAEGAPLIHDQFGDNEAYTWSLENGEVDRVFSEAPVVIKERYYHPRVIPNAIEPRGVVVQSEPAGGDVTMYSATQVPHIAKITLSLTLGMPEQKLRVVAPAVGGGFGSKLNVYSEEAICIALSRKLDRPMKWIEERSENYVGTIHGRSVIQDMEIAATEEGKTLGFRVKVTADMGAYLQLVTPGIPLLGAWLYHGVYSADAYRFEAQGVFTNRTPTDAYRGAGRPEATYAVERAMEALARRVGKTPVEIRKLNFIPPFDEATEIASGLQFDSGHYERTFDKALEIFGYDDLRREQAGSESRPTSRCAGWRRRRCSERSSTAPEDGTRPPFAVMRRARSRW